MFDMGMGADMMDMGAMDMDMGAMDMEMGAMDMEIGAMDMAMGDPIAGMEMMAIGETDMAMGQMDMAVGQYDMAMGENMMGVGMMEAEMGMMGAGIGMMGAGMMGAEIMGAEMMGGGMMGAPVVGGGMMGRRMVPMGGQVVQRPVVGGQMRPQQYPSNTAQQQMMMRQQQARVQGQVPVKEGSTPSPTPQQKLQYAKQMQRQEQQLLVRKQQILQAEKEKKLKQQRQLQLKRQQHQLKMKQQQKQLQQLSAQEHRIETIQKQTDALAAEQGLTINQLESSMKTPINNVNPYVKQQANLLFMGRVSRLEGGNWQTLENATATYSSFLGIAVASITKMKVKAESKFPGTKLMKISTYQRDYFFSVQAQEQIQWMTKLIIAKVATFGQFPLPGNFQGSLQGPILKKSFFGNWEPRVGVIEGSCLKVMGTKGGSVDKVVSEVEEIWTRFQTTGGYLVVKMHSFGKLQLGVPMEQVVVWMQGLYNLIK